MKKLSEYFTLSNRTSVTVSESGLVVQQTLFSINRLSVSSEPCELLRKSKKTSLLDYLGSKSF